MFINGQDNTLFVYFHSFITSLSARHENDTPINKPGAILHISTKDTADTPHLPLDESRHNASIDPAGGLLVELVFLVVLLDVVLVALLEVLGQHDVAVLPHGVHASLPGERWLDEMLGKWATSRKPARAPLV